MIKKILKRPPLWVVVVSTLALMLLSFLPVLLGYSWASFILGNAALFISFVTVVRRIFWAKSACRWPTVTGKVLSAHIRSRTKFGGRTTGEYYEPQVKYQYRLGDATYTSDWIWAISTASYSSREEVNSFIRKFKTNNQVAVYHHPRKKGVSVLQPGCGGNAWLALVILGFMNVLLLGVTWFLYIHR